MKLIDLINDVNFKNALALDETLAPSSFRSSIRMQFLTKGKLSEKQATAFVNAVWKDKEMADRKAAWKAEQQAKTAALIEAGVQAPEGRIPFTGAVRSLKFVLNAFGGATKLLIEADSGAKVWVSLPSEIKGLTIEDWSLEGLKAALAGKQVSVTATFKRSDTDATFAFGSRPNALTVLG